MEIDPQETYVNWGGEIKAVQVEGGWKLRAPLVVFSDATDPDLTDDYFDASTDFDMEFPGKSTTYFNHGMDSHFKKHRFAPVTLVKDDFAVWAEGILSEVDEYEKFLIELGKAGKLGMSSGVPGHLVEREPVGKAMHVTLWALGKDASYTHTPAEPKTRHIVSLKSLVTAPIAAQAAEPIETQLIVTKEEMKMAELDEKTAMLEAAKSAAKDYVDTFVTEVKRSFPSEMKAAFNVAVTHDEADTPFTRIGDELKAVQRATLTQGRELAPRLKALNMKALGTNELIGSEGGFLLEPSFAQEILQPMHESGAYSSRVQNIPIGAQANGITVRAVDETSRVTGSRWGGIQGYRLNEAGTFTASTPTFRLVELRLKKYAVICYATDELLQDSTALGGIIQQGASEELSFMVNDDIFEGSGQGGPLGILKSPALISVAKEAGQPAATIMTQNIVNMWKRCHPASKGNSVWFINTDCTAQIYQMSLSVGTGGMPMFMLPGSLPNSPAGTLMGRPVVETEYNSTLGTLGDIVLADMSQYAMIQRDVTAASSIHVQFLTDQTCFRFVYRCDGQPKIAAPLTPFHGTNTLSPFVALATRS